MMDFLSRAETELNKVGVTYEVRKSGDGFQNLYNDDDFVLVHRSGFDLNFPWLKFAQDWHSDEEYSELKKENELLKSKIKNILYESRNRDSETFNGYHFVNELLTKDYIIDELEKLLEGK